MLRQFRRRTGLMAFCHSVDETMAAGEQRISDHVVRIDFLGAFHETFEDEDEVVAVSGARGRAVEQVVLLCLVIAQPDMKRQQLAGKFLSSQGTGAETGH